jgi:mannose-6-phosphate isomerase
VTDLPHFDPATFTNQPFVQRIEKPWGYEILFTEPHLPYAGKILHIRAGQRLSLQMHDAKRETQYLFAGRCLRIADNEHGELVEAEMQPAVGYTMACGQRHRLQGITDCDIFEVSTPELGITYRLHDDYARPHETEQLRQADRAHGVSS